MYEAEAVVLVVPARDVEEQLRPRALRRHAEVVAVVAAPEDARDRLCGVAVLALLLLQPLLRHALEDVFLAVDVVELYELSAEAEAKPAERDVLVGVGTPEPLGVPDLCGIGERHRAAGADDVVLVVPPVAAVALDGQLKHAVEEVRLGYTRLVRLDARARRDVEAALLPAAAEELRRCENVEVGLRNLRRDVHGVHRACADADHEVAGVLLLHLVDEVAVLGAIRVLAAVGRFEAIANAGEVVEVLEAALAALGAVLEHSVAGGERNLAADDLVLRVVVAANLDVADHDRHSLGYGEHDVHDAGVGRRRDRPDRDMRVGEAGVSGADRDLDAARGVRERLPAGDHARLGELALLAHDGLGIARDADDLRRADLVACPLGDVEANVHLAVLARHQNRLRDADVEVASIAVRLRDLRDALRKLLARHGSIGEPPDRIPPRHVTYRVAKFRLLDADGARELVRADLAALSLLNHEHHHRAAAVRERFHERGHLCVVEVLLLVSKAHPGGRRREVGLAVEVSVLELCLVGDLRLAEEARAPHDERRAKPELALHAERHLYACGDLLHVCGDVLELLGVLERGDIARERDRIIGLACLRLAAAYHGAGIAAEPVHGLDFDRHDVCGRRGRCA